MTKTLHITARPEKQEFRRFASGPSEKASRTSVDRQFVIHRAHARKFPCPFAHGFVDVSPLKRGSFHRAARRMIQRSCDLAQGLLASIAAMQNFTPISALVGGALIGIAASVLLLFGGRIAGISGITGGSLMVDAKDRPERLLFIGGLLTSGLIAMILRPSAFPAANSIPIAPAILAGLLVGFGTRLGNGCTSGHGVCGLSRLSIRSLVATITFMVAAAISVFVVKHVVGGSP